MTRIRKLALGVLLASAASAASAPERFTPQQLEADFYFDLGPAEIDVAGYPRAQQQGYATFASVCSRCHTLARPINSPIVARADWRRYIKRMHARSRIQPDKTFTAEQAKRVVEFLAYDAKVRKIARRAEFDAETERLKKLFVEARAERSRLRSESDARKVKPYGDRPSATPRP